MYLMQLEESPYKDCNNPIKAAYREKTLKENRYRGRGGQKRLINSYSLRLSDKESEREPEKDETNLDHT